MFVKECSLCAHYEFAEEKIKTKVSVVTVYAKDEKGHIRFDSDIIDKVTLRRTDSIEYGNCLKLDEWVRSNSECKYFLMKEVEKDA